MKKFKKTVDGLKFIHYTTFSMIFMSYICICEQQCQSHPIKDGERSVCSPSFIVKRKVIEMKRTAIIICVVLLAVGYIFAENNSIEVSRFSVLSDKLPESFDGLRIVQISDLHNKDFGSRLTDMISELEPDIIVITGDIIDSYSTKTETAIEFTEKVADIAPVYYITGNHESRLPEEYAILRNKMEENGVAVLDGRRVVLERNGESIALCGIDDPAFFGSYVLGENEIQFKKILADLADGGFGILLSHRPELIDLYVENGFDLVFSGHAHGGQIRLPFIGGIFAPAQGFFPEYTSGLYESGETSLIVSRGLGNSFFPFRIGNRPEIVLCELEKQG